MIIKPRGLYKGIEELVSPEMFFNLVGWDGDNSKASKINFYVNEKVYIISEKLLSVINMQKYGLAKGSISIGAIGLAKKNKLRDGQTTRIIKESNHARGKYTKEKLFELFDGINSVRRHSLAMQKLKAVINKYGSNKYNLMLAAEIGEKPNKAKGTQLGVPKKIEDLCNLLDLEIYIGNMFEFNSNEDKCWIQTRIPYSIKLLIKVFLEDVRDFNETMAACYRGAFITGLFMILKWIENGKLQSSDEFCFAKLVRDVELIITDNY